VRKPKQAAAPTKRDAVVVAVVNMKGGVGKSTVTANLGWHSAYKKNHKVLLVDLDPQFNLSQYALGSERYQELFKKNRATIYDIFEQTSASPRARKDARLTDAICTVKAWNDGSCLDLIPSRLDLSWTLKSSTYSKTEHLKNFLQTLKQSYDLVLIDCPPTQSMLTDAAYAASNYVLIPIKPEFLSTIGLPLLVKSLEDYRIEHQDHEIEIAGILFNAVSEGKAEHQRSKGDVMALAKKNNWYVFKHEISFSDSYPKGSREGKPIFLTGYARWDKVNEFAALANEFLERIGF
jgi:chromosome partitioning protein